jgi:hypothetical protein
VNPTSANYWLPLIEGAGLPVPRTLTVDSYDHRAMLGVFYGEDWDGYDAFSEDICKAAMDVGLPVFIRTDMGSAKHNGPVSYRLDRAEPIVLTPLLRDLVEDQESKFWLEPDATPSTILVRRWLDLDASFEAFGWRGNPGHPIAREWRLFATAEGVECVHFYWPEHAIEEHNPTEENWRELLAEMASEPVPAELTEVAVRAAAVCDACPMWSVDFAQDIHGRWYLIDMAEGDKSWHPEHDG